MEKKVAKIIFLDFDGVLNTEYHQRQLQFEGKIWQDRHGASFDPEAVKQLQAIVDKTHADIVIESSWKYLGLETMQETRGTGLLHLPTIKFSKAIVLRWLGARQRLYLERRIRRDSSSMQNILSVLFGYFLLQALQ